MPHTPNRRAFAVRFYQEMTMTKAQSNFTWCGAIATLILASWSQPAKAQSGLEACGNIHVEAQASCEVIPPSVDCESMCTPVKVRAACSGRLAVACDAGCNELPSVDCSAECVADCSGECKVDPGKFDCAAACRADCSGRCDAGCAGSEDGASCMASCEGSCSASCDSHCDVDLPKANCDASCKASCEGSCQVETNLDCQIDCQARGRVDCEAELTGGCKVDCKREDGALFCDGQYVDHGDNLQQCLDALQNLDVQVQAEGHAEASGSVNSNCSTTRPGARSDGLGLGLGGAMLAFLLRRRRP